MLAATSSSIETITIPDASAVWWDYPFSQCYNELFRQPYPPTDTAPSSFTTYARKTSGGSRGSYLTMRGWSTIDIGRLITSWQILRPTLDDAEIRMMPFVDVVKLYYSICKPSQASAWGYDLNPIISNGLPPHSIMREMYLRERIYNLRQDLHYITGSDGKKYHLLIRPSSLLAPDKGSTAASVAGGLVGAVFALAGGILSLIYSIASTVQSASDQIQIANLVNKLTGLGHEVGTAIQIGATMQEQRPSQGDVIRLRSLLADWRFRISDLYANLDAFNAKIRALKLGDDLGNLLDIGAGRAAAGLYHVGTSLFFEYHMLKRTTKIFPAFFYSPSVRKLIA